MALRRLKTRIVVLVVLSVVSFLALVPVWQMRSVAVFQDMSNSLWLTWSSAEDTCTTSWARSVDKPSSGIIDTADLYESLDFGVQEGSRNYWNKTFEERYLQRREMWKNLPLEVIVVPYSHIDPGWLRTYDEYFDAYVQKILDNMVEFLNSTAQFTFTWSEVSYFSQWFNKLRPEVKGTVIKLIKSHQLEITTGGWVMPDEATTHYWALVDQLVEGHQWLQSVTGHVPDYAWSVDVFGHSSTIPLLLSAAGMKGCAILRTHYAMKSYLASIQSLDFYWRNIGSDFAILSHMFPSELYSIKHACGPDPRVCLQFDFRIIQGEFSETLATEITEENIRPKAERLLGQYGRYASLFPHNVLLVPLGDDFRYDKPIEWTQQYQNYDALFRYINSNPTNAHVRFGTVGDYFETVSKRILNGSLPSLQGDFMPYADIYADGIPSYWTGYYTTRPFEKALTRELEHWLRSAEILYSFARSKSRGKQQKILDRDYVSLIAARQTLGLFQHHDAITGTSRVEVVRDYRQRLHHALKDAMAIVSHSAQHLTIPPPAENTPFTSRMYLDLVRGKPEGLTEKIITTIPHNGRDVVIFNSLSFQRRELIRIKVRTPYIEVQEANGKRVPSQINPAWSASGVMLSNAFELIFVCDIAPLSFTAYKLIPVSKSESSSSKAEVSLHLSDQNNHQEQSSIFSFTRASSGDIIVDTSSIVATLSHSGLLKEIYLRQQKIKQKLQTDFYTYLTPSRGNGAYLFNCLRDNPLPLRNLTDATPLVRIVRGELVTEVTYILQSILSLTTRVYLYENSPPYIDFELTFDVSTLDAIDLFMRLETKIESGNIFYTDSNGLQMLRRKHVRALPLQGNIYPVVSAAYLEDSNSRINLLTSLSHGLSSPSSGTFDVMVDRRLRYDDFRGLGQGVLDNKRTTANFRLLLESTPEDRTYELPVLSAMVNQASLTMNYPVITLISDKIESQQALRTPSFAPDQWPVEAHLVNLRTLSSPKDYLKPSELSLLTIFSRNLACERTMSQNKLSNTDIHSLLNGVKRYEITSLTATRNSSFSRTFKTYKIVFHGG